VPRAAGGVALTDDLGLTAALGLHQQLHPATRPQMHAALGVIESRLLCVGGGLARLMRVYRCLEGGV
jgi:hypothetical protein